ncbi:MAG: zinc ribbon domain-containing protein [Desulfobacteraceae bacterium]|nr:zinc ribbon domain-containing protein [Desulfobacteraceae bacterium]
MPIYEYQCTACQKVTEAWQGLSEAPLTTCQYCSGPLKKMISMSSFHLKGGGWYADGYSNGGAKDNPSCAKASTCPAKAEAPAASSSDSSSAKESKPACGQGACCGH